MMKKTASTLSLMLLAGCSMAPRYHVPATPPAAHFKEAPGWTLGTPADDVAKGQWWKLFGDPTLNDLEARVAINNQNVAASAAAYNQARATVRELRASLFPTVDLTGNATRAGSFGSGTTTIITSGGGAQSVNTGGSSSRRYSVALGATWEPDLWGRISSGVRQQSALAQASLGDLNNATLSAQGELASNYVQLRGLDRQKQILDDTVTAYDRALTITTNRYNAGIAARVDLLQAQTQLTTARANAADLMRQRQAFEHAIAVLVGENPSSFSIQPAKWAPVVPVVPGVLPSTMLQRRPDIAAAERRVAAANQAIGVEKAAFFPTVSLSGSTSTQSSTIGSLFTAATSFWSLGAQVAETILDWGARSARVKEARYAYDQAVANYRQAVLTAFQQVEDNLAAAQILHYVAQQRSQAATVATRVEDIALNQYKAGQIAYTDVITQQTTALTARQNEASAIVDQQTAAIALIQAIGGSWPDTTTPPAQ